MSGIVGKLIKALHQLQTDAAIQALKDPRKTPDASYDFGLAVGRFQGIEVALSEVVKVLNEDEYDES